VLAVAEVDDAVHDRRCSRDRAGGREAPADRAATGRDRVERAVVGAEVDAAVPHCGRRVDVRAGAERPEPGASGGKRGQGAAGRGGREHPAVLHRWGAVDAAVDRPRPAQAAGAGGEREQPPAVVADVDRPVREGSARGDLVARAVGPARLVRRQVERVHRPVPGAEVVDAVEHERRGLDRRAHVVGPEHPAVVAVEDVDPSVHPVRDEHLACDRGGRRHLPGGVPTPDLRAVSHRVRAHAAVVVRDEGNVVAHGRRELHQPSDGTTPHDPERRPHTDERMRLGSAGRGAVAQPLELRLEDADADLGLPAELETLVVRVVAAFRDGDGEPCVPRDADLGDAVTPGPTGPGADPHLRAADGCALVAVQHDDVHERQVPRGRRRRRAQVGRRGAGGRLRLALITPAAREQHEQRERYDSQTAHDSRLETPSVGHCLVT
jgi:hypothetical protein